VIDLPNLLLAAEAPSYPSLDLLTPAAYAVAAVLALVLLVVCFRRPAIGKFVGKLAAVVSMGLGVGGLVWGILAAARGDQPPATGPLAGASYNFVIGCGAGFLTAGIVALVLACLIRVPVPLQDVRHGV
jgi:hypothetical protein